MLELLLHVVTYFFLGAAPERPVWLRRLVQAFWGLASRICVLMIPTGAAWLNTPQHFSTRHVGSRGLPRRDLGTAATASLCVGPKEILLDELASLCVRRGQERCPRFTSDAPAGAIPSAR